MNQGSKLVKFSQSTPKHLHLPFFNSGLSQLHLGLVSSSHFLSFLFLLTTCTVLEKTITTNNATIPANDIWLFLQLLLLVFFWKLIVCLFVWCAGFHLSIHAGRTVCCESFYWPTMLCPTPKTISPTNIHILNMTYIYKYTYT